MNNPIQVKIIGDKRLLQDGALIEFNGTLFDVYKYNPTETIDDADVDEQLNELFEYHHKKARELRREEDVALLKYATGSDIGTCKRILMQYEKANIKRSNGTSLI